MHSSGLRCSHNSELDTKIPRAKLPKRALPDCLRKKLKGVKVEDCPNNDDVDVYKAGSGVLAPVGSAPDGTFLKRGSGVPMSLRASALAQRRGDAANARATIHRATLVDGDVPRSDARESIRWAKAQQKKAEMRNNELLQQRGGGGGVNKQSKSSKSSGSFTSLPPINQHSKYEDVSPPMKQQRNQKQTSNNNHGSSAATSSDKKSSKRAISLSQQLDTFLSSGNTPRLVSDGEAVLLAKKMSKPKYQVKFDLVKDALTIMNKVNQTYGKKMGAEGNEVFGAGDVGYIDSFFGPPISHKAASAWIEAYVADNDIVGKVEVKWAPNESDTQQGGGGGGDNGSVQVGSRYDEKEDKVRIIVSESFPGIHRAFGVQMFAHHEIATRGLRMLNDVHQPWSEDRKTHGMTSLGSRESGFDFPLLYFSCFFISAVLSPPPL
jgi:hypothetical protein